MIELARQVSATMRVPDPCQIERSAAVSRGQLGRKAVQARADRLGPAVRLMTSQDRPGALTPDVEHTRNWILRI